MNRKEPQPLITTYVQNGKKGSALKNGRNLPVITVKKPAAPPPPPPPKAKSK